MKLNKKGKIAVQFSYHQITHVAKYLTNGVRGHSRKKLRSVLHQML